MPRRSARVRRGDCKRKSVRKAHCMGRRSRKDSHGNNGKNTRRSNNNKPVNRSKRRMYGRRPRK